MAKLIYLGIPAHGHVNPSLAVVEELVNRGHEVIYFNIEAFRDVIERTGAEFRVYPGLDVTLDTVSQLVQHGNLAAMTALVLEMSEQELPYLLDILREESPDLLIYDSLALWGYMAAQLLGLPSAASITHFILDGTTLQPSLGEGLRLIGLALPVLPRIVGARFRLSKRYGRQVFQRGPLLPVRGDVSLVYTSESLQPPSDWIDASFRFVGPSINAAARSASAFPFEWLTGEALAYVSLGTIHQSHQSFFDTVREGLADFPGQVLMSIGPQARVGDFAPVPPNFLLRNSVPQLEILQRADLFVTHGGMNSVHESLYYSVPMILVPQQIEQLLNARVIEQQGAGILLGSPFAAPVSNIELREAVSRIQDSGSYRARAEALGQDLRAAGGYQRAADEILAVLSQSGA